MMCIQQHVLCLTLLVTPACAGGASTGANLTRSPTLDYQHPQVETSDGQVVGADRMPPERTLRQSPKIGTGGLTPAATPTTIEEAKPETLAGPEDPQCAVLGMSDVVRKARCYPAPVATPKR